MTISDWETQKPVVSSDDSGIFPDDLEPGFWGGTKHKSALAQRLLLVWEHKVYGDIHFPYAQGMDWPTYQRCHNFYCNLQCNTPLYKYSPQSKPVIKVHFISNSSF